MYFVYDVPLSNDEYDIRHKEYFSKVNIVGSKTETLLLKNISNIDSVIIKDGFIYAVIHKKDTDDSRHLFRMTLDGKNIKQISSLDMSSTFIGSKYIYYTENSFADKQSIYRITLDGKNNTKIATAPGRISSFEYYNGSFYLEVQPPKSYNFILHKVAIK
ncbi:DUF5050 domain-containing protein [Bacillus sp. JJ722]|uniref:DUF5050 domain-containing protein n=1 Tax=Bacillus sp. JJ722 TaxID=3122973 RepID=UPI002FFF6322